MKRSQTEEEEKKETRVNKGKKKEETRISEGKEKEETKVSEGKEKEETRVGEEKEKEETRVGEEEKEILVRGKNEETAAEGDESEDNSEIDERLEEQILAELGKKYKGRDGVENEELVLQLSNKMRRKAEKRKIKENKKKGDQTF